VMTDTLFIPPRPEIPAQELPWHELLRTLRINALRMWPQRAYEEGILSQSFFGRRRMLLNDPDAIHRVLVENAGNYRRSPASIRILRPIVGNGLFLSDGEAWKHQRRTIAPALAPRVVPMLARHVAIVAQEALTRLRATAGTPIDLLAAMQFVALDVAGRSMFSLEMGQHGAALRRLIARFGASLGRPYLLDMVLPASIPTLRDIARRRFGREWFAFMDRIIETRLAQPPGEAPRDLFDLLLAARDPETGAAFPRPQLRDQVATLIVAGHETTAVALFWSFYLLAQAPAWQQRLAAEARDVDLGPDGAGEALTRLVEARAVVSEALRLYPPAFVIVREAVGEDRVGDVAVRRGAILMVAPWVLHRHRRLWRDPDAFDPTRFLPDAPPPPRFSYLPFGAGPRVCIGAQFALAEATLVLATVMRDFEIALEPGPPVLPAPVVTTQPSHPPLFRLLARATGRTGAG
jgi:cytochrome P450